MSFASAAIILHNASQIGETVIKVRRYEGKLHTARHLFVIDQALIVSLDAMGSLYGLQPIKALEIAMRILGLPLCLYLVLKNEAKGREIVPEIALQSLNIMRLGIELSANPYATSSLWMAVAGFDLSYRSYYWLTNGLK